MDIVRLIRPKQLIKNVFVFPALLFSRMFLQWAAVWHVLVAFVAFTFAAWCVYAFNDLIDAEADRAHPTKKLRPIAAGRITPKQAICIIVFWLAAALAVAALVNWMVLALIIAYLVINVLYSLWFKHHVLLDLFCIAAGFLLRIFAGGLAISVMVSPWLLLCSLFLSLLLASGKRRAELLLSLEENTDTALRPVLRQYNLPFLDLLVNTSLTCLTMCYVLYELLVNNGFWLSSIAIVLVCYALFRYLYNVHVLHRGGSPEEVVLRDKSLLISMALWLIVQVARVIVLEG